MKKLIPIILILFLFLVACEIVPKEPQPLPVNEIQAEEPEPTEEPEIEPGVVEVPACTVKADCEEWKDCIDGECKVVADLYNTECENKCDYNNVVVKTSDGNTLTLSRGQGSYTSAGAVEWKLMPGPKYCPDENLPIPIKLLKKNTGEILSEEIVTLKVGETSNTITHPTISRVSFTVTVESINEVCS
tara:strand:- start:234 stop:797 length:564 start_codon:yes stop_codon:yes gene_type:complete